MAGCVHLVTLSTLSILLLIHVISASASSAIQVPQETPKKILVKRPPIPIEPACDDDYGVPDYLACLIGVSWIPPDGSDLITERLFGATAESVSTTLTVQLPKTIEAGDCFIRVEVNAARGRADYAKWSDIRSAAAQVTHRCVGARRLGGTTAAGENYGLAITVYHEGSPLRDALARLAEAASIAESQCVSAGSRESAGSNEACSNAEAQSSLWSIPAYRPSSTGTSCSMSRIITECILNIVQRSDLIFGLPSDRLIGALIPQLISKSSRSMDKQRHALVKRLDPPHCDEDYGFPDQSACRAAWNQMPSETSRRVFVRDKPVATQVKLPLSKIGYPVGSVAANSPCIITVNLELHPTEVSSFSEIKSLAANVIDTCLGWTSSQHGSMPGSTVRSRGWGGYQLGGLSDKISVTVYASRSYWNGGLDEITKCESSATQDTESEDAVDHWCAGVLRDEPLEQCGDSYCTNTKACCDGNSCVPLRPETTHLLLGLLGGVGACLLSPI